MEQNQNEMLVIRREKLHTLKEIGKDPHCIEKFENRTYSKTIKENFEEYEGKSLRMAGRIVARRGHGKVCFLDMRDAEGQIQLFMKKDLLGESYEDLKLLDIGDIVGVEGEVFRTQAGEISLRGTSFVILSKSLQILPEKWHGLKDADLRYRQRYVDLIVNPEVKETFITRSKIIKAVRKFLDERGYLEVETPILNTIAGGANARPFVTHHNTLDIDMFMRIANELYLKRLIVGGFDKVYEMGRMFRNEGMDHTHNPEYTAIELYEAYADYEDMMALTEQLFAFVAQEVLGTTVIEYQGKTIDLTPPWRRLSMTDALKEFAGVDFDQIQTDEEALAIAEEKGVEVKKGKTRGFAIDAMFEELCEEYLEQPTFITHHPVEVSPLAKRDSKDPRHTHRFEAFINCTEYANAFSELNDAEDQRQRFESQAAQRAAGDDEAQMMDTDFVNALEVGLPPTGGLGIGIDRMIMLLTGNDSIRDILLFPTMKPVDLDMSKKTVKENKEGEEKIDFSKVKVEPLFEEFVDFDTFIKSDFRAVKVLNCEEVPKSKKLLKFTLDDGSGKERTILSGIKEYYTPEELLGKTLIAIINLPPRAMMGIDSCGMLISAIHEEEGEERLNLLMVNNRIPAGAKLY